MAITKQFVCNGVSYHFHDASFVLCGLFLTLPTISLSKATDNFPTCIRGEKRKIFEEKVLQQPGIEPTSSKSRVKYAT